MSLNSSQFFASIKYSAETAEEEKKSALIRVGMLFTGVFQAGKKIILQGSLSIV